MGDARGMHGREDKAVQIKFVGKTRRTENISEGYSVIGGYVKWILKKWDRSLWTGFIWLRIRTKCKFL
jgi:hypothetical protein